MTEYAMLYNGAVVNVITTALPLDDVRKSFPSYEVKPLDQVPQALRDQYEFWGERPR